MSTVRLNGISLWVASDTPQGNVLRSYLLKWRLQGLQVRFSHAHVDTTFHTELTLLENLLMAMEEIDDQADQKTKESLLEARLVQEQLSGLMSWFKELNRKILELSAQERLLAAICHALIKPADVTLIDLTSVQPDPLCMKLLQKILQERSLQRHITLYATSTRAWSHIAFEEWTLSQDGLLVSAA